MSFTLGFWGQQKTRTSSAELGEPKAVLHSPEYDFHHWKSVSFSCFLRSDRRGFGGEHNRVSKFRPAIQKVSNFLIWIAARILKRHQIQPSIQASQMLKKSGMYNYIISWWILSSCRDRSYSEVKNFAPWLKILFRRLQIWKFVKMISWTGTLFCATPRLHRINIFEISWCNMECIASIYSQNRSSSPCILIKIFH